MNEELLNHVTRAVLVKALAEANETIGNLQGELRKMQARIAELEQSLLDASEAHNALLAERDLLREQLQAAQGVVTVAKALIHFDDNDSEDDASHRSWRKLWRNLRDAVAKVQP